MGTFAKKINYILNPPVRQKSKLEKLIEASLREAQRENDRLDIQYQQIGVPIEHRSNWDFISVPDLAEQLETRYYYKEVASRVFNTLAKNRLEELTMKVGAFGALNIYKYLCDIGILPVGTSNGGLGCIDVEFNNLTVHVELDKSLTKNKYTLKDYNYEQ